MPIQEVVAAVRHVGNQYWIVRRNFEGINDPFGGLWEFPGGMVLCPSNKTLAKLIEEGMKVQRFVAAT